MTLDAPKNMATSEEKPNTWHAVPKRRARRTQRLLPAAAECCLSLAPALPRLSTWPAAVAAVVAAAAPKSNSGGVGGVGLYCALFCRQRRTQFFFRPPSSSSPNSSRNHQRHVRVPDGKTGRRHRRPPHKVSCADNSVFSPNSRFGRSASLGHFLSAVGEIRSDTSPR